MGCGSYPTVTRLPRQASSGAPVASGVRDISRIARKSHEAREAARLLIFEFALPSVVRSRGSRSWRLCRLAGRCLDLPRLALCRAHCLGRMHGTARAPDSRLRFPRREDVKPECGQDGEGEPDGARVAAAFLREPSRHGP